MSKLVLFLACVLAPLGGVYAYASNGEPWYMPRQNEARNAKPLLFDLSKLSKPIKIASLKDFSDHVTLSWHKGIDVYQMAPLVKRLGALSAYHEATVKWREDNCLEVDLDVLPSDIRKQVLTPGLYSHSLSPTARLRIYHTFERLQQMSVYKILRAFNAVSLK